MEEGTLLSPEKSSGVVGLPFITRGGWEIRISGWKSFRGHSMGSNQSAQTAQPANPPSAFLVMTREFRSQRNLLKNPCARDHLRFWQIDEEGGDGWRVEQAYPALDNPYSYFVTSYRSCKKSQLINLHEEGYTDVIMDLLQPPIVVRDWYAARTDCGCQYELLVQLLSRDKTCIQEFSPEPIQLPQERGGIWHEMTHTFHNYGRGVRFLYFQHGGKDTKFWAGHYGVRLTYSSAVIKVEDLRSAHQRALQNVQRLMDLSSVPEVVLLEILSHVSSTDLLYNCRTVCKQWKDAIDSPTLWKIKCQRAGYITRDCQRQARNWKIFYYLSTQRRNLIRNPSALEDYRFWRIEDNGGDHWRVEHFPESSPRHLADQIVSRYFVTSYGLCTKSQLIDLREMGYNDDIMDSYQPDIVITDWFAAREDCGSRYELTVRLLSHNKTPIQEFSPEPVIIPHGNDARWHQMSHTFRNYGAGVRYIYFLHGGKDTQFWAGWYGIRVTNSSVIVQPEDLGADGT